MPNMSTIKTAETENNQSDVFLFFSLIFLSLVSSFPSSFEKQDTLVRSPSVCHYPK